MSGFAEVRQTGSEYDVLVAGRQDGLGRPDVTAIINAACRLAPRQSCYTGAREQVSE